jgi:hypothetical protein
MPAYAGFLKISLAEPPRDELERLSTFISLGERLERDIDAVSVPAAVTSLFPPLPTKNPPAAPSAKVTTGNNNFWFIFEYLR